MSFKTADVLSPFTLACWNQFPGQWMIDTVDGEGKKAEAAFRSFVQNKVPQALTLLKKLINGRHIAPVHLPLNVYTIFLIYIDEQIELYQNQREERDPALDLKWQEFKVAFSKERSHLFIKDSKWATPFFEDLKRQLTGADALGDFEETISFWMQLIGIAHIGDMCLAALFEKKAKSQTLHSTPQGVVVDIDLPRRDLETSFYLALRRFSQDLRWIIPKMVQTMQAIEQKMQLSEEGVLGRVLHGLTSGHLKQACSFVSKMERELKAVERDLLCADLTDNRALKNSSTRLKAVFVDVSEYFPSFSQHVQLVESWEKSGLANVTFANYLGEGISFSRQHLPFVRSSIEEYQECHLLSDGYLVFEYATLSRLLASLQKSNEALEKHQKNGIVPRLVSPESPSLLPSSSGYDEKVVEELLASASSRSGSGRKKGKKSSHQPAEKKQKEKAISPPVSEKKTNEKSKRVSLEPQTSPPNPVLDPLEQLREKMFQIRQGNPSPSLRQALWHLDALISIQQLFDTKSVKAEESLTIFDAAVSSAQKLLEQTYRFCGGSSQTAHNLKTCHSACSASPYPEIVKELYLANHWTRYFYIQQQKWRSISTQDVQTPPLLEELVKLAEGTPFSPQELQQRVKMLIEKTCRQVEQLLPQAALSPLDPPLAKEVAIQWKAPIEASGMETVKSRLKAFLADAGFSPQQPVYLYVKQAIAALAMLKDSLVRIQTAHTPRELATWTSWCLQQVQETIENVLHAIEYLQEGEVSVQHDLKALSEKVGLKMGDFAGACDALSYKPRYPIENSSEGLGAQILDDVEAFKHHPECLEGFQIVGSSPFLWKMPSQGLSLDQMGARLESFIKQAEAFLRTQAVPLLLESM